MYTYVGNQGVTMDIYALNGQGPRPYSENHVYLFIDTIYKNKYFGLGEKTRLVPIFITKVVLINLISLITV